MIEGATITVRASLEVFGISLPLRACTTHLGSVIDLNGAELLVVDANGERGDDEMRRIVDLVVSAVNSASGLEVFA